MKPGIYIFIILIVTCTNTIAQNKIGCVYPDEIVRLMPENTTAILAVKQFQDSLQIEYQALAKKINEAVYKFSGDTLCHMFVPDPKAIAVEHKTLIDDITGFLSLEDEHQKLIAAKSNILFGQVRNKLTIVIKKISEENGYQYVLDFSDERLRFLPLPEYDNITDLVLCKLNL